MFSVLTSLLSTHFTQVKYGSDNTLRNIKNIVDSKILANFSAP